MTTDTAARTANTQQRTGGQPASEVAPGLGERWYSKRRIAEHYDVSIRTVERWLHGGCPARLIGGVQRFRISDVEDFLDSRFECGAAA